MREEPAAHASVVLVLDDEAAILGAVRRILERQGYEVLTASSAREALDQMEQRSGAVDLLICDLVLPGLGGREAANTLRARQSDLKVLYMSGYSTHDSFRRDLVKSGEPFVGKPFEAEDLIGAVRRVLSGS